MTVGQTLSVVFSCLVLSVAWSADAYILRAGDGEALLNGLVIKASPKTGTQRSILVEQSFQLGGKTVVHQHEQGDELFYVVSGHGMDRLGGAEEDIGHGDVIFIPASSIHQIRNQDHEEPLVVVFFMDSPELVDLFRAIHERVVSEPDRPITLEEIAIIEEQTGGGRTLD